MSSRPPFDRPIAHRGLHDRAAGIIENSRSAFEAAIARGFAIECDVQLSSDGEAIVFHDDALERLTGHSGFLRDRSAAELTALPLLDSSAGDRPMRFDEFLAQIGGRTLLQIELKRQRDKEATDRLAARVAAGLSGYRGPMVIESFDPAMLVAMRRHGYAGSAGIITYAYDKPGWEQNVTDWQRFVLRHLLHWPWTRFDFISCSHQALDLPVVRLLRKLGMPVTAWTVRTAEEAGRARQGADQIVFEGFDPDSG